MEDSVRGIFMTLIKVPVIIVISYFVFNVFAFGMTYFKMLGVSYMVSEVALENNYIPNTEKESLDKYFAQLDGDYTLTNSNNTKIEHKYYRSTDTEIEGRSTWDSVTLIDNLHLVINTDGTGDEPMTEAENKNDKVQYGVSVRAGIAWDYYWIWPLISVSADDAVDQYGFYYEVNGWDDRNKQNDGTDMRARNNQATNHSEVYTEQEMNRRKEKSKHMLHCQISYVIPGMKYYPDLD